MRAGQLSGSGCHFFSLHPTPTQRTEMYKIASSLFLALIYVKSGNLDVEATAR